MSSNRNNVVWRAGYKAYYDGIDECPYEEGDSFDLWMDGWLDAVVDDKETGQ